MVPLLLDRERRQELGAETLKLAGRLLDRLGKAPATTPSLADINDDGLISDEEAASMILGLQDREIRDRAAEWMEGPKAYAALRLWRALARRCVAPYEEHAAAPLTLAGWVSWSTGDEPAARVALGLALRLDPHYTFAQLLHEACNQGLDPETLRRCLRGERSERAARHGRRAERVAGARPARVKPAGRARTRPGSTRPGPGAADRRRSARPGVQGRRGTRTGR